MQARAVLVNRVYRTPQGVPEFSRGVPPMGCTGCTRCVFFKNSHIASHSMFFALAQCANLSQALKSYIGECELSLFSRLFVILVNLSSRILHRCSQGRHGHPKFLAYVAILCFEKRRPKQKYCCSPKVKYFAPPKF